LASLSALKDCDRAALKAATASGSIRRWTYHAPDILGGIFAQGAEKEP
jgi:hypothetical protein